MRWFGDMALVHGGMIAEVLEERVEGEVVEDLKAARRMEIAEG